ncbi:hypothetical protein C0J52_17447 [Blattella germanica]|nr:hypothetical protein C0J52_17447 [Blattella germanica]
MSGGTRGLKLRFLEVPTTADMFSPVTLRCDYDLEGGNLYSVKWYKDGSEFFRFMPDYTPQSMAVRSSGIFVDLEKSGMNEVTLMDLRFNNSGNYKCEVSTEAPNFETVAESSNMTIMAYPSEDPMIEGVLSTYQADSWVWEYRAGADETDAQGLHSKTVGLQFQILNSHFVSNQGLAPQLEIRCTSKVGDNVRHKSMFPTIARTLTTNKFHQERLSNTAELLASSMSTVFTFIITLRMVYIS